MKLPKGLIVSLQGYTKYLQREMAGEIKSGGAVAIRTDKPLYKSPSFLVIGLQKVKVINREKEAFITPTLELVKDVYEWADLVAIDYRVENKNLPEISDYCRENKIPVVADIGRMVDYENIIRKGYYYSYIATTLSVLYLTEVRERESRAKGYLTKRFFPDILIVEELSKAGEKNIIAEGNYRDRKQLRKVYDLGAKNVCIGTAITGVYELTKKYAGVYVNYVNKS